MKRTILAALLAIGLGIFWPAAIPAQTPIGALYGANLACDPAIPTCTPIPLTLITVCTTSCPRFMAPTWGAPARMWGSNVGGATSCFTSSDSGATWVACSTEPFSSGAKEDYAGTADGNVIASAQVAGNCVIKRSTDTGSTWNTVFTYATSGGCGGSALGDFRLKCLATGVCVLPFVNVGTQVLHGLSSSDNGQTWAAQTTVAGAITSGVGGTPYDGTNGIQSPQSTAAGTIVSAFTETSPPWSLTAAWPDVGDCWGAAIYNGLPKLICFKTATGNYQAINRNGTLLANLTLPGVNLFIDTGAIAYGWKTNVLYVVATKSVPAGPAPIGVWVSQDNLSTFNLIATTAIGVNSMKDGSIFSFQGCLWFSAGATSPMVGKIC